MRLSQRRNEPAKSSAPVFNRGAWIALEMQKRRRARAPAILLTSDGHGHLTWTINFIPHSDESQPGLPYSAINIYWSADGVTWGTRAFDGGDLWTCSYDGSGGAGYFRICICDWNGNDVPPYSNAVYSDGL